MVNLRQISLMNNQIKDLRPMSSLVDLQSLNLSKNSKCIQSVKDVISFN